MAGQSSDSNPTDEFEEYMLLDKDPDLFQTVFAGPSQISPWIDPSVLNLKHRIGRGPFGDVWIATHHQRTEDYDRYHEVAVKMLHPIKKDQLQFFSARFDEIFSKCQGLGNICFLHGISTQNGRICIAMKFYEGSIGDKMARLKGGKLPLSEVLSAKDADHDNIGWGNSESVMVDRPAMANRINWLHFKDKLQVGDKVRSRKLKNSCSPETMEIPDGTIVGIEEDGERDPYILVRVHGLHDPLKVRCSTVERVTYGFAAGDWVRLREEDKKRSQVGILHSIDRDGAVTVGLIGMDTLWKGNYSDLQMAEVYCVGQFVRLKANISSPRFEWQRKKGGGLSTGRISHIHPNGCLVVKFPGKFNLGEVCSCLADPYEVEVVSFDKCEGIVKKYEHLEDFHWAVRPLFIAIGFFTALKLGVFVGKSIARPRSRKVASISDQGGDYQQQQQVQNSANGAWLPPPVANMLFGDVVGTSG